MSRFAQPSSMDFDSVSVPWNFPYIVAFLQGKPQHFGDDFFKKHPPMDRGKRAKFLLLLMRWMDMGMPLDQKM